MMQYDTYKHLAIQRDTLRVRDHPTWKMSMFTSLTTTREVYTCLPPKSDHHFPN